ncbi:hypothetical protein HRbin06_00911 [archaeon HR06]|nr:hypothetical protein HRbin06_00911 [archaeon HR06]
MIWYFAYGSNLNLSRLKRRIGEWKESHKAILEGYRLTFRNGVADIEEKDNSRVYGAVYLITEDQLKRLDKYEGPKYKKIMVKVKVNGKEINAIAYYMREKAKFRKPHPSYLNIILEGLKDHGYSEDIIKIVEEISKG